MALIDSYEVGQKLTKDDFVSDYYFPWAKWEYAEVTKIDGDAVELHYVNETNDEEDTQVFTQAEMEEMLGWDMIVDDESPDMEVEDEDDVEPSKSEVEAMAYNSPCLKRIGSYELLDSPIPSFVKVSNGVVKKIYLYASKNKCLRRFNANTRQ